mgnify:CR=1 FL=1|tara:strand:- start:2440 stop:3582 length:1143 start_codon:yes stop_codon:yes gene_type:complete
MSEALVNAIKATNGTGNAITMASGSNTATANLTQINSCTQINSVPFPSAGALSNRNLIINGAMNVAQRGTSAAGTGYKTVDRFTSIGNGSQAFTQSQDTDVPAGQGFAKSLKFDCTTALASPAAGNYVAIQQKIEAQDLQCIANGTSNAKKVTLSFWVKSPKTGNHAVGINKPDNTNRQNTKTYSVSAANTWEKKTITFDGDTSGGGIANDNGIGFTLSWFLMVGSTYNSVDSTSWVNYSDGAWAYGHAVNCFDNTDNNFYLTGVQLEIGEYITDFEYRSMRVERQLCERYFQRIGFLTIWGSGTGYQIANWNYAGVPVQGMRNLGTLTRVGNIVTGAVTDAVGYIGQCSSDPWCQYIYSNNSGTTYSGAGGEFTIDAEL